MKVIEGIEVLTSLEELVDPRHTAVMCIDMQNEIASDRGPLGARVAPVRAIIPNIQRLLDAGRRAGALVAYAEFIHRNRDGVSLLDGPELWPHRDQPSISLMQEGSWEAQTIDELAPRAGDLVILKSRGTAFCGTLLDAHLGARGIRSIILTGTATSGCVFATWIDARTHGYYPVLVTDAVAEAGGGRHEIALEWMGGSAPSATTEEVIHLWAGQE